eukprot:s3437_g5.t2
MTHVLRRCHNLLQDYRRKKLWKEAVQLLDDLGQERDRVALNCTISACSAAARWQEATSLLSNDDVDCVSFAAALGACAHHWQRALQLLKGAEETVAVDVGLYNAAIAILKNEQWQMALAVFQRLHLKKLQPDLLSFNTALSACASWRRWEEVLSLLDVQSRSPASPDAVGLSTAISSLPARQWATALQLFDAAEAKDTVLCGSAISVLSKASERLGRWQNALVLFFDMGRLQVRPNTFTCSAALSACDKGLQWILALELLKRCRRDRLDGRAYCSALSACGKASQWPKALELFRQSQLVDSSNLFTFNATLSACEKGQQWPWTIQLLEEAKHHQLQPDLISFNSSIQAASLHWPTALRLFSNLQLAAHQPDTVSFNAVLNATDAPEKVMEGIFQQALESKAYPWLLARGSDLLDLHDLSPGAVRCAISWWLDQKGYWSGRHSLGLELIFGLGLLRKSWAQGLPLRQAALQRLQQLSVPWAPVESNAGRVRVLPRSEAKRQRPPPPPRGQDVGSA